MEPVKYEDKLPESAFTLLRSNGRIIRVDRGESGYTPYRDADGRVVMGNDQVVNALNEDMGVTIEQRFAMDHGSMFGWDTPGSNPEHNANVRLAADQRAS